MNRQVKKSLRKQFITRILLLLILISAVTGGIQGYLLYNKINDDTRQQASMIASTIEHGINETDLASRNIEHQIDLKLELHSKRIADQLQGRKLGDITSDELAKIRDDVGVTGITILGRQGDDIVNMYSTDAKDVGFSWKKVGQHAIDSYNTVLKDETLQDPSASYVSKGIFILFAAQSAAHTEQPTFFKYAYYHAPGTDYIVNAFIEASEVYNFTQKVGPDTWIEKVLKENSYTKEIAVLDPRVFADPSLEQKIYPPLKQVINGKFQARSDQDVSLLKEMAKQNPSAKSYIEKIKGQSLYKMFLPTDTGRVIYIALDYKMLSATLYKYSLILIISGFISLVALFMFTANFFNKIYRNIQQIIYQIKQLQSGDLTAKSFVSDGGELSDLSESANKMALSLNQLLTDTHDKATRAQKLSVLLENEANQSVEKAFTMSMQTTSGARESVEDIFYFIDLIEKYLQHSPDEKAKEILDRLDAMRQLAKDRTNNTTEITITLSDLFKSLHNQSSDLSDISKSLQQNLAKFKLAHS